MKKLFTIEEIFKLKGCYTSEKVSELLPIDKTYSIIDLMNLPISIHDKRWFIYNSCDLTKNQKLDLCIILGKAVAPIYNKKYPYDNRIDNCWKAVDDFRSGKIKKSELIVKITAAYIDIYDCDADYYDAAIAAYYAAIAAYYAARATYINATHIYMFTDTDTDDTYKSSYCSVDAATYSSESQYHKILNDLIIKFCEKIEN